MVKKIIFIILMVSVLGCINNNHSKLTISEFNSEKYNIIYYYGRNISFNLLEKKINIHFKEINYYDTIILKKLEEENIIKSFYNNEIYKISGERTYIGNIIIMPNTRDKIQIIKNQQKKVKRL
jgi:hypothetical protein